MRRAVDRGHAREQQERRAAAHRAQLIRCLYELNSLVPIGVLPPELLVEVFRHCQAEGSRRWLHVTHVCKRWREVALGSPGLWASFACFELEWTRASISRSRECSLHVELNFVWYDSWTKDDIIKLLALLFEHGNRIRSLRIAGSYHPDLTDTLLDIFPLSCPLLETLYVEYAGAAFLNTVEMPSLKQLSTYPVAPALDSPVLRSPLTHLTIDAPYYATLVTPDIRLMIRNLETLENLSLSKLCHATPSHAETPISLPRLCYLRLSGDGGNCAYVLKRLVFPSSTRLHLVLECDDYADLPLSSLEDFTSAIVSKHQQGLPHSRLPFHSFFYSDDVIRAWTEAPPLIDVTGEYGYPWLQCPEPILSIVVPRQLDRVLDPKFQCTLLLAETLREVTAASFRSTYARAQGGCEGWSTEQWRAIFDKMALVEHLDVRLKHPRCFLYSLTGPTYCDNVFHYPLAQPRYTNKQPDTEDDIWYMYSGHPWSDRGSSCRSKRHTTHAECKDSCLGPLYLPILETLGVSREIARHEHGEGYDADISSYASLLRTRQKAGFPLRLELKDHGYMSHVLVEFLRQFAKEVTWDQVKLIIKGGKGILHEGIAIWGEEEAIWGEEAAIWSEGKAIWRDREAIWGDREVIWGDGEAIWDEQGIPVDEEEAQEQHAQAV